jgi:hypothetical protein
MPNKSIHQLPVATTREAGDKFVLSREIAPGSYKDYQIDEGLLWPSIQTETITITSSQILDLFTTRVELVSSLGDGSVILPIAAYVSLSGVGTPYATNTDVRILGANAAPSSQYWGTFSISSATDTELYVTNGLASGARLYADQSLYVQANNGNPTAGDGVLSVTILYVLYYP